MFGLDETGKFDPQALLSTNLDIDSSQIIAWFMLRWCLEVTFQEVRLHLGVETQKQWSDLAIFRTTLILFGLFSIVTLVAHDLSQHEGFSPRRAAWYFKPLPTFSDALATLRERLWRTSELFDTSLVTMNVNKSLYFYLTASSKPFVMPLDCAKIVQSRDKGMTG